MAEATSWLDAQLAAAGQRRTGPVEQPHLRPWATVLTAATTVGRVWLKAAAPGTAFEVRLYDLLARVVPDDVLLPLAIDTDRAFLLLPDGGESVGNRLEGDAVTAVMLEAMVEYGRLQRELAGHTDELLAAGVLDMRPPTLLDRFDEALAWAEGHVDPRVPRLRPELVGAARRLAAAPGGASLDHNDLHPWNVLGVSGRLRFYDWGDSVVAHPFASLLVPLEHVEPAARARLRDAYLDGWADLGSRADLLETAELACRFGHVSRTLANKRAVIDPADARWGEPGAHYLDALVTRADGVS